MSFTMNARSISNVRTPELLEFPSFAPDESKLSPVGSLGNIEKGPFDVKVRDMLYYVLKLL